ncbi:diguanylate cyclase domain-containing protein [Actinoplanes subglobosus]|uniref:Diguanylate cyclase domain-containing protein n=1 Tax=Actinoplanes subglobosus TaxID=1547892 RepID=A0ABV8J3I5_9ACTN
MTRFLRTRLSVVIVLAVAFQAIVPFLSLSAGRAVSDAIVLFLAVGAVLGFARRVRTDRGRNRTAAVLASIGAATWASANALFLVNEIHAMGYVFLGGAALSVAAAVLLPVGLHLSCPPVETAEGLRGLLDVAAVSGAVLALTWMYILEPAGGTADPLANSVYTAALIGPEVIAATVALVMMSRNLPEASGDSPRLLGSAAVVLALSALLSLRNQVAGNPWYTAGAGAGFILAAGLVMIASRVPAPQSALAGTHRHFAGAWAALPYVPIVLAVVATAVEQVRSDTLSPLLIWVLLSTFSLVLARQFMTVTIVGRLAITLERQQERLAHQAHHDALTGLHNRTAFTDLGRRLTAGGGTVLLLDLDGFKPVNDRLGHAAGDDVLVTVAQRLTATARTGDLVVRLGGDEFAVVLADPATEEEGRHLGTRILTAITAPMPIQGEQVTVGGSIGLAAGHHPLGELLRRADIAMYSAKAAGKGTIHSYSAEAPPRQDSLIA